MHRTLSALSLATVAGLLLAGCSSAGADGDGIRVVASTNVYGQIAEAIGGDLVEVTSLISSVAQDPHAYEASARDQLTISRADLIVRNGGGYDAFVDGLIEASDADAVVLTAVEFSHAYPGNEGHATETEADHDHDSDAPHDHIEGFNEHVWYDPHTVAHVAEDIAHELSEIDAAHAADFADNLADFQAGIEELEGDLAAVAAAHAGDRVFVTEPVPVYLLEAAGLVDAAPAAFSEAVEEGQDVPPSTLLEARDILGAGDVRAVLSNAQTGGAETGEVLRWAAADGIPVLEFTELVPEGETYLGWMRANVADLAGTLTR
ncbi:metal ABC transporter solute-binding protein, Zn/Mn family [uncultured Microbacterium sp.]|uniref:ABC-type metal ion transport system, periplasmic component/surface adhesin n=1 Tax=uncultured Microbacterium sp. TaxID=191216 RepID=A0A1Y5P203_9MICO|nr:zinc ABC transporter substrate-binding protein [uncultured Microbacterium sp.]SBS72682.1 ABC-type metal ion transport system, periplasmic component/surface adhesin [uncultured Microbacterium sp.]